MSEATKQKGDADSILRDLEMIISHSRKFCYWKIARTGSNTAELCIRMSRILDLSQDIVTSCHFFPAEHNVPAGTVHQSGHTLPSEAIAIGALTREQYDEYDHYTIVRHPIERWISAYAFRCRMQVKDKISPMEFYENHKDDNVTKRQWEYLTLGGVQTFPFSDYENSIRSIVQACGGVLEDVPKLEHKTRRLWLRRAQRAIPEPLFLYYGDDFLLDY